MNLPSESPNDIAAILRARAQILARPPPSHDSASTALEVIEFALAHERYALETSCVTAVHALEALTPLPGTPPFIAGIVNVRGRIIAVLDIRKFFDLPEAGITDAHQIMLVRSGDMEFAILADLVIGARSIPSESIQSSLPTLTGVRGEYLKGVTAERLVILDAGRIAADPRIIVQDEVET